ncbi:MAG TPA: hypothetical protein VGE63_01470 [Candidatus Paceibacterota bacterium]
MNLIELISIITPTAEAATAVETANKAISKLFTAIINPVIKLAFVVGIFFFFYTIIRRVLWERGKTDEFGWKEGRGGVMVWGILGLFIMIAAAGIIGTMKTGILKFGKATTGGGNTTTPVAPEPDFTLPN